ncbi:Cysteine proteinase inhibitor 6, partial [Cucurbita argyrosperma subsp. sororia]
MSSVQDDVGLQACKPHDWKSIEDIKDPYVQEIGRFAMTKFIHHQTGKTWTFIRVVNGETLAVEEGMLYRVVIEVKTDIVVQSYLGSIELYVAKVLDHKQPRKSWELLAFESSALLALPPGLAI